MISLNAAELAEVNKILEFLNELEHVEFGDIPLLDSNGEPIGVIRDYGDEYFFDMEDPQDASSTQGHTDDVLGSDGGTASGDQETVDELPEDIFSEEGQRRIREWDEAEATHSWLYGAHDVTCTMCHCSKGDERSHRPCRFGRVM